eukprot:gb/GFBE01004868.1/.p1 GENE.gb/GFBE01004868.1/~~gb/GFBE01004868.1/.p1  ORF type:complete len:141 (+),score=40.89 gb/GFBE01004868.1/:1-423(+)
MPHGDFSDLAALSFIGLGVQHVFYPHLHFDAFPPFQPVFDAKLTPEIEALIKIVGGLLGLLGFILFTVRWNTINGKLSGLGCILLGALISHTFYKLLDKEAFVLRPPYVVAGLLVLTGLKLMFFANPLPQTEKSGGKKKN